VTDQDEAVERVARAMHLAMADRFEVIKPDGWSGKVPPWEVESKSMHDAYRMDAQAALTAISYPELLAVVEAARVIEILALRNLVNGTSLPMDMQPWRERLVRDIDRLADSLSALANLDASREKSTAEQLGASEVRRYGSHDEAVRSELKRRDASRGGAMRTATRFCALCGHCETHMTDDHRRCWDAEDGEHVWNALDWCYWEDPNVRD